MTITITMTVIFSLLLFPACSSFRTFDLIGVSGGRLSGNSILIEDNLVQISIENFKNKYDIIAFRFQIRNKSSKFLKLDVEGVYLRDLVGSLRYPLSTDEVFKIVLSHKVFETPREKMRVRRGIAAEILRSGEIPPLAQLRGVLFFESQASDVRELALIIRGLSSDGIMLDFQNVVFRDENYEYDLRKVKLRRVKKKAKKEVISGKKTSRVVVPPGGPPMSDKVEGETSGKGEINGVDVSGSIQIPEKTKTPLEPGDNRGVR